jgi:hypothetical protein
METRNLTLVGILTWPIIGILSLVCCAMLR